MPPDLNTLPPSPLSPPTSRAHSPTALRTTMTASPHSLAATAAMNAGIQTQERRPSSGSMRREVEHARRRSSIRMNLNLADPAMPAPGEMQTSPRMRGIGDRDRERERGRTPSLGEMHQELEYEQEGQVNRLLSMIRAQQAQIASLQSHPPHTSAVDDTPTPTSERSISFPPPSSRVPLAPSMSRQSSFASRSHTGSQMPSPSLHPMSAHPGEYDMLPGSATMTPSTSMTTRDESAFYQAETQNLTRENQMLKSRIRDLERQLLALDPASSITHSPALSSALGAHQASPTE